MANKKQPNPVDIHVGARVRLRRTMLGMSQTALAEQLGITFQQVQKYEKGTNRMGASRLQQTASVLSVPPGWFFEDAPGSGIRPDAPDPLAGLTAESLAIARDIATMRPEQVRSVGSIVSQIRSATALPAAA